MELYKWYSGNELQQVDGYIDCIIIYNPYGYQEMCIGRFTFEVKKTDSGITLVPFWYGVFPSKAEIPREDIVVWMPIEFPKEVS